MKIASAAFAEREEIPAKYTCDGLDVSPPLKIDGIPEDARSLAIIADDPDAPGATWVHWVAYGILPDTSALAKNDSADLTGGARHGSNDFGRQDYGGPCPPPGSTHRYFFKVYALSKAIDMRRGATKADLLREMEGSALASAQLMATYRRR